MAASYPSSLPDLATLVLSDPLSFAQFTRLIEETQAALNTLGINPQGAYGTLVARVAALEARLAPLANTGYRDVRLVNQAAAPTTKLVVTADLLAVEGQSVADLSIVLDLTATGKNGMTHPRAVSTWYFLWVGVNPTTGEVAVIADDQATRGGIDTSHASLAGFTAWRRIGARRTNATGAGEWTRATQHDGWLLYQALEGFTTGGSNANQIYTRTVATSVPSTSRLALVGADLGGGTAAVELRIYEADQTAYRVLVRGPQVVNSPQFVTLDAVREFDWSTTEQLTNAVFMWTDGYYDPF
jgi:hypothetical protein